MVITAVNARNSRGATDTQRAQIRHSGAPARPQSARFPPPAARRPPPAARPTFTYSSLIALITSLPRPPRAPPGLSPIGGAALGPNYRVDAVDEANDRRYVRPASCVRVLRREIDDTRVSILFPRG
ncbi:hypothetical protein EVAR_75646_1 [Eumeta japonica]|uniref:Uncharacterized protein n=1 Tax=Eumeta variegata TaxID=151549 RepID=A0A4C1U0U8_EUMVA|nr:hypothetical protein EVAR_75646_1 [Eumeta japonica]